MVDVKALIASIERLSWKGGNVTGRMAHEVDADGTHRIIVTVPTARRRVGHLWGSRRGAEGHQEEGGAGAPRTLHLQSKCSAAME